MAHLAEIGTNLDFSKLSPSVGDDVRPPAHGWWFELENNLIRPGSLACKLDTLAYVTHSNPNLKATTIVPLCQI